MTLLGIDYGSKRIGLAVSDPDHRFAVPYKVLDDPKHWIEGLRDAIAAKAVTELVVGLPLSLRGTETASTQAAKKFVTLLKASFALPVRLTDERLSTVTALQQQRQSGLSVKKGRTTVDALAACALLDNYIASILKK